MNVDVNGLVPRDARVFQKVVKGIGRGAGHAARLAFRAGLVVLARGLEEGETPEDLATGVEELLAEVAEVRQAEGAPLSEEFIHAVLAEPEANEEAEQVKAAAEKVRATLSGDLPAASDVPGAPAPIDPATGQHGDYYILPDQERAKGFVRPVRESYRHLKCGTVTKMPRKIAETYARDPKFYGATFCCACRTHLPVGPDGEFVWEGGDEKVGT